MATAADDAQQLIEGVHSDSSASDGMPDLENREEPEEESPTGARTGVKFNRAEKKSRKAVQRLGMKPVPGVLRVVIRKSKQVQFVIHNPTVYKTPNSEQYVVFGVAKVEDVSAQAKAAQRFAIPSSVPSASPSKDLPKLDAGGAVEDEAGVESKDVDLVMTQTNCSRAQAVKSLRENEGDIVEAIMQLSGPE
eukprot:Polyplicarium_translucidae@DN148_c0_g1_i1.p2